MPSSYSFLLNSQSSSSSSSSENDSKSDQSDNDDDINVGYYKKRTIQNDNDMLERPSDHDESCSQTDDTDNDEKENDIFTSSNNPRSLFLTRHSTFYDNDWPKKSSIDESYFKKSINRDEAALLEIERNDTLFLDSNRRRSFSSERSSSVGIGDKKHQSRNIHTTLPSDLTASVDDLHTFPVPDNMQTISSLSQTKTNIISSPIYTSIMHEDTQRSPSKIPIRTNPSSQSKSRSPAVITTTNRRIQSPTVSSKIPLPISTTSQGAFHFFTADDRPSPSQPSRVIDSTQVSNQTNKQVSPFTPITHSKTLPLSKKTSSSAGNTPSAKHRRARLASSDDDDDSETNNLQEADLKLKLKEQKRHGKQTGELLDKLHENYEDLLEKYAQAENTIDQLRFQPKNFGDNTPPANASEGTIHFIQQPQMNTATLRSSGIYHSTSGTPLSSIRQVPSTTTTTTTPVVKSISPANSGTIESVFFDEPVPQKIIVQELTTPETIKLDLLIQTKTLSEKMKSFLTLMEANQLSLAEQKQVYETIKEDYEKLLKTYDRTKRGSDSSDIGLDVDLNQELETMKHLLKEIVKRITDNLLGKSSNSSETGRNSRLTRDESQSSQLSARSSLCNHGDLMDQYQKLLNAVNTGGVQEKNQIKSLPTRSEQIKKTTSLNSSQSDTSGHLPPTTKSQKPYIYVSGKITNYHHHHPENELSSSSPSIPTGGATRYSASSVRTRTSDYDSGIGTNNTTKLSRDRLNTSTMDESHYQSLDEERRRYSDEEQQSMSSVSSSRSSGSGAASPSNLYSKYTKRFDGSSPLKQHKENCRRKPSGHSDVYQSDTETHIIGSFDPLSQPSYQKRSRRSHHSVQPQQTISNRTRLTPARRSVSTESFEVDNYKTKSYRPQTAPQISSRTAQYYKMGRKYQSGFIHRQIESSKYPDTMYKSSFYIDQAHTHRRSQEKINQNPRSYHQPIQTANRKQTNNLYLDPQTGVIYRYISNKNQPSTVTYSQPTQVKPSGNLYQCAECGSITTYHHRHHMNSNMRRVSTEIDDPGYESGNRKLRRRRQYIEHLTSSDSDSDENPTYIDMSILNEAYNRARKAQYRSQSLSKHISRQLKLVLGTI